MIQTIVIGSGIYGYTAACAAKLRGDTVQLITQDLPKSHSYDEKGYLFGAWSRHAVGHDIISGKNHLQESLRTCSARTLRTLLAGMGVALTTNTAGQCSISGNTSQDMAEAFSSWADRLGVSVIHEPIKKIEYGIKEFVVQLERGKTEKSHRLIVATSPLEDNAPCTAFIRAMGHTLTAAPPLPRPLSTTQNLEKPCRVKGRIVLWSSTGKKITHTDGEILFSGTTIDGPAVRRITPFVHKEDDSLTIDFLPQLDEGEVKKALNREIEQGGHKTYAELLACFIPPALIPSCENHLHARGCTSSVPNLRKKERREILFTLKQFPCIPESTGPSREPSWVVDIHDRHEKTGESTRCEGLFFAGPCLGIQLHESIAVHVHIATAYTTGITPVSEDE
ncbi:NAD(P)/FAD-dependent oxidoreductase [Chitinivibrio alkaliphilus]|uniref:RsdA/BaiN/AoA(So)-like insert domain-containing protein n=1 Tax=Chitinivibrio alkaliphilus ACht1 TaxID=1313304 RepID=U7D7H5_9BACT|nr:NAD(P)/FAD-dependent oxidoreductase [Chitinivibrio alkaliphilus]ERP38905.1 hypothetical protein CALK_0392 [Chitinivibrio alkaliphilus ACht1]